MGTLCLPAFRVAWGVAWGRFVCQLFGWHGDALFASFSIGGIGKVAWGRFVCQLFKGWHAVAWGRFVCQLFKKWQENALFASFSVPAFQRVARGRFVCQLFSASFSGDMETQ